MYKIEKYNGSTKENDACFEQSKLKIREARIFPQILALF